MLNAICGHDPKDSTSAKKAVPDFEKSVGASVKGLRIGIPKEYRVAGTPEEIINIWEKGIQWLKAAGAEIVEITLPHTEYALPAYYIIAPAEASSNLARYDGVKYGLRVSAESGGIQELYEATRGAGFGHEVKRRIMIGTYVLSHGYYDAYYKQAQRIRTLIHNDFAEAFKSVDAILTPTTPSAAFQIGENADDPVKMYLNDVFTVSVNLAYLPAISVPAGLNSSGLPLGLQVIANHFDEETCLKVGAVIEDSSGFTSLKL
jgi:aspartyl-tRNA(Asn)/glutamyl-tRNA(Gln) amidotransferase subunit A